MSYACIIYVSNKRLSMKSVPAKSNSPDDGALIQQIVKRGLIALSLAIILLSATALWTIVQLTDFHQNKVERISEQKHLLHVMRIAALKRTLLLYTMLIEEDPFLNDNNRMAFYSAGAKFSEIRIKFTKLPLDKNELDLLDSQADIAKKIRPKQRQMLDLINLGENKLALRFLQNEFIPDQNRLIQILQQLNISVDKKGIKVKGKAESLRKASIIILIFIVIVIILGAIYITRQTTTRTSNIILQVNATRKMLQNTIHELIQQKSALDSHAIVSIADKQGNITYVNDKFCQISGYNRDELIGKNHRLLKSGEHSDEFYQKLWSTISQGKIWQDEICNRRKNGGNYWVESTITPFLDDRGIPYQYVSIRTEITHLLEAKIEAEAASRSKSLFISSMSHELRTPMNAILGFSQLIDLNTKDELTKQNINEVINAGNHLLNLINEILNLSQIESGKVEIEIDSYSLKNILGFCLLMIKPSADEMSIKIDNKIDSLPDIKIKVDEQRFKQIVLNILSNAVKYNKENGSVIIDYSIDDNKMLNLSITDTGKGIALKYQNNIFNSFDRAGEEGSNITGSGLGLVITKTLIEKMNGTIGFESTEGKGSCFWINIPLS